MKFAASGLSDVALEPVPVDEWDVQGAWVRVKGRTMVGSQFAGVPGTDGPVSVRSSTSATAPGRTSTRPAT